MRNHYISDLHIGHKRIIEICGRPFKTMEEMHNTIISNWNNKVSKDDTVYVLGDAFFYDLDAQRKIMKQLNGRKILINGNHDKQAGSLKKFMKLQDFLYVGWDEVIFDFMVKYIGGKPVGLVHDPAICNLDLTMPWLCGHVHNLFHRCGNIINVGVDMNNFTPLSEDEIIKMINNNK